MSRAAEEDLGLFKQRHMAENKSEPQNLNPRATNRSCSCRPRAGPVSIRQNIATRQQSLTPGVWRKLQCQRRRSSLRQGHRSPNSKIPSAKILPSEDPWGQTALGRLWLGSDAGGIFLFPGEEKFWKQTEAMAIQHCGCANAAESCSVRDDVMSHP